MSNTSPTPMAWTPERSAAFWDFACQSPFLSEQCMSRQAGRGIVRCLGALTRIQGDILDFGCGPGHLIHELLGSGAVCHGVDTSPATVVQVNTRFENRPRWGGAKVFDGTRLPFSDGQFDTVTCIDTIEHILPEHMDIVLSELRRVLRAGSGTLFITTPNAEDLTQQQVFCPACRQVFHAWQHLRAFDASGLARFMEERGFTTARCAATNFVAFQETGWPGLLDLSPRATIRIVLRGVFHLLDLFRIPGRPLGGIAFARRIGKGHNLFWLGTR